MATTILPKKTGFENPIATDDDHHSLMANDPSIQQFPQGSSFGSTPVGGFGSGGGFSSTTTTTTASFGNPTTNGMGGYSSQQGMAPPVQVVQNQGESLKNTGGAMQEGADILVKHDKESTDWINKKWRPMMGWIYMATCTADFVIFPVLWSVLQALSKGNVTSQWQPLTLQGAGLYHIAMGAVLGIAAYGRTKEKLESKQ